MQYVLNLEENHQACEMHHTISTRVCMHAHPEHIACRDLLASGIPGDLVAMEFAAQMKPHVKQAMQAAWHAKKEGETREAQIALAPLLTRAVAAEQPRRPAVGPYPWAIATSTF